MFGYETVTFVGAVRSILYQNLVAVTVNVAGNLLLIPHFGAWACAALTLLTECVVCAGSLWSLSRRFALGVEIERRVRPFVREAAALLPQLFARRDVRGRGVFERFGHAFDGTKNGAAARWAASPAESPGSSCWTASRSCRAGR